MRSLKKSIERRLQDLRGEFESPDYHYSNCFMVEAKRNGAILRYEEHLNRNLRPIYERLEVVDTSGKRYFFERDNRGNETMEGAVETGEILRKFFPYKRKNKGVK